MNPVPSRPYSSVHLLIALALLFASSPFIEDLPHGALVEGIMLTAVMLSALFAVAGRGSLLAGWILAAAALIGQWTSFFFPHLATFALVPALAFTFFVILRLLGYVLRSTAVNHETLCAAISGFLLIGLLWAMAYITLARWRSAAFSFSQPGQGMDGFDAFYFSFITLSTIGFGDITPVTRIARMLTVMEAITGMFYMAILISRLVSIHSSKPPAEREK